MWHIRYGNWWALQWCFAGWFSFGIHIDFCRRLTSKGLRYGPYIDFHFGCFILSLGIYPIYSGDLRASCSVSRGGIR